MIVNAWLVLALLVLGFLIVLIVFSMFLRMGGGHGITAAIAFALTLIGVSLFLLLFGSDDTGEVVMVADSQIAVVDIDGVPVALEASGIELDVGDEVRVSSPLFRKWRVLSFSREVSD